MLSLNKDKCCYCGGCVGICPEEALTLMETELKIDQEKCTLCEICVDFCPVNALGTRKEEPIQEPETIDVDVVIVGAGPAGSICAKYLARSGINTLVVERKQEIGAPKRCAEGTTSRVLKEVGIEINPLWLTNRVRGAVLYAPNHDSVKLVTESPDSYGLIIERKVFEKHLAKDAIKAGAKVMVKTTAKDVIKDHHQIRGITAVHMGEEKRIMAKITVAADGVDSMIGRRAGLDTVNKLDEYMSCAQYEMAGVENLDDEVIHTFFGNKIAPGGYIWIFPKGHGIANVGIGIRMKKAPEKTARDYLDSFIRDHPNLFEGACAIEINSGAVPVSLPLKEIVGNGLMIIGDAAHLVNPASGAGIQFALDSGRIAAEVAVEALKKGDVTRKSLSEYQMRWEAKHGKFFKNRLKLQKFTEHLTDENLNRLAKIMTPERLEKLLAGKFTEFVNILTKETSFLKELAVKYLKSR